MKRHSFVLSAIILALGGFFAKAIGALYKIPLTNILGSGGMGLYYLIFPVYSLIITFCSSGINVALSTEVARCRMIRHRYNEQKLLRVALLLGFGLSLFFSIIVLIISRPLAELQGNINARLGYIAIAPAIIISSLIATLRGYFQGVENMVPTTVSMIIEQIVKLSTGLILAHKMCNLGIQYAVLGAVIGVTISEVIALIIIAINFVTFKGQLYYNYRNMCYKGKCRKKIKSIIKSNKIIKIRNNSIGFKCLLCSSVKVRYTTKVAFKRLLGVMIPSTFSSIMLPIATMLDSFLVINILIRSGFTSYISTSLYGLMGGVVQSLISLPTIIIAGIATSIVPSLSGVVAGHQEGLINQKAMFFIKITLVLSVIMSVLMFIFAEDILIFLYGDGLGNDVINEVYYATRMLQMSSISIIYYAFLQTFTAILQAIGKPHIPFGVLLGCLGIRIFLTIVLVSIPNINVFGAIIANIVFLGIANLVLVYFIRRRIEFEFRLFDNLIKPVVAGIVTMLFMYIVHKGLKLMLNYFVSMLITGVIGIVIFVIWIYLGKVFSDREKRMYLRKIKKISK